jgi:hypothetical protein
VKKASLDRVHAVERAHSLLKEARDLLKLADARQATDKVRAAIISTQGAEKNVRFLHQRTEAARMPSACGE